MHKSKIFILAICLAILSCSLITVPAFAVSMSSTQGVVGTTVTVYDLDAGDTYLVLWDGDSYSSGTVPSGGYISFTIPEAIGGTHTLLVESPSGTQVYSGYYTIIPSIDISPDTGTVGTTITVTGDGFADSETDIEVTYDDDEVITDITADDYGSWSTSFTVSASYTGTHAIDAYGDTTLSADVEDEDFTVEPEITVSPSSCDVGDTVTVSGSGFAASETSIKVILDSTSVKTGITADSYGSWSTTFTMPSTYSGSHTVSASGSTTDEDDIEDVDITVVSGISIDETSVYVGDVINVTGTGFGTGETGIYITFDDNKQGNSITADSAGYWETSFTVPAAVNGVHTIGAYGSTTSVSNIEEKSIEVLAKIKLDPTEGNVGDTVAIKGSGFSGGATVTINFGTISVLTNFTTDSSGSFSEVFEAPKGTGGDITVIATDAGNIYANSVFAMDKTPPSLPQIKSPEEGTRVGFIGDTKVEYKWTAVTDPSGVSYDIQVAEDSGFSSIVFEYTGLTVTEYKSVGTEALPEGQYYWRVRAIDGAANSSGWTDTTEFKAGLLSVTAIILILVIIVMIIILLRVRVVLRNRSLR